MNSTKKVIFNKYRFSKWSNNTKYERTIRQKNKESDNSKNNNIVEHALQENQDRELVTESQINSDINNYNNIKPEFDRLVPDGFIKQNNKREGQNEKLLSRGMMIQKNINPFLDTSHYVKHLDAEENFLRPKDSNFT